MRIPVAEVNSNIRLFPMPVVIPNSNVYFVWCCKIILVTTAPQVFTFQLLQTDMDGRPENAAEKYKSLHYLYLTYYFYFFLLLLLYLN